MYLLEFRLYKARLVGLEPIDALLLIFKEGIRRFHLKPKQCITVANHFVEILQGKCGEYQEDAIADKNSDVKGEGLGFFAMATFEANTILQEKRSKEMERQMEAC